MGKDMVHIYNGILLSHRKNEIMPLSYYGWTSRDCHTEWSVRQEKISYDIPYIWNLKNDRIKLIYKTHCKLIYKMIELNLFTDVEKKLLVTSRERRS